MNSRDYGNSFDGSADFDPAGDFDAFLKLVPARWVVYLMTDADDRPVQLLCVKNLRQSLKRRLGAGPGTESSEPQASRRVDYRQLVRRVHYRRVDSRFETDVVYLELARVVFPEGYQNMVGFRPAWFLHVDPEASFPRYVRTSNLDEPTGLLIGPLEDRHIASRLIEQVESAFDLCRYHSILTEAPNGKACAYKEMKRCPAPCDGSLAMHQYRRMVEMSARVLVNPGDMTREHEIRMRQAATELKFELAARIKQYVDELSSFGKGPYRHARLLQDFQFIVLQRGPREGTARVFLITPGEITEEAGLIAEPASGSELLGPMLQCAEARQARTTSGVGAERVAVVAAHLFSIKNTSGVFVRLDEIEERSLVRAYRELMKQKSQDADPASASDPADLDEGVLRELSSAGESAGA